MSEEQCRALMEQRRLRSGLTGRVHGRNMRSPSDFPSMQTVAAELGMSVRTLRNHLARESPRTASWSSERARASPSNCWRRT